MVNIDEPMISKEEVEKWHNEVLQAVSKLGSIIPEKYSYLYYNLENIIEPKAYGYHTNLDNVFYRYHWAKKKLFDVTH